MTKSIEFSVVIPMYNSEATIERALNSISNQTINECVEIIIVNDGSSDNSREIVESYIQSNSKRNRTFLLVNKENNGVASARNVGMEMSSGQYIAFLDSDDYFHEQKLEFILCLFQKHPNVDILGHSCSINVKKFNDINVNVKVREVVLKKITFINVLFKNFATTPSVVFRNSFKFRFDETMRYTEDHDFFLRFSYFNNNMYFFDIPLTSLGREPLSQGGLSSNKVSMRLGEVKMYTKILKLNKLYIFILPFLLIFSLLKFILKLVR